LRRIAIVLALLAILAAAVFVIVQHAGPAFRHPLRAARLILAAPPQRLPVPVVGVRARDLTDSWGSPRSEGRHHEGIDICAPRGHEVVSTTAGIVVTVGHNRLGGRVVRVLGPGGWWHYYAHLESFADVREVQPIARGTLLGTVGNSGDAAGTPTHLHYGIYRFRGGAMNPFPLLASGK
jgi:murein DD-endopeptidase MepM/ murein hydrolase activator NlpD